MVRSILVALTFAVVPASGLAEVIVIDDGQRHDFAVGDVSLDDTIIVLSGRIDLPDGSEVGRIEVRGTAMANISGYVSELLIDDWFASHAILYGDGTLAESVTLSEGSLHVSKGAIVNKLSIPRDRNISRPVHLTPGVNALIKEIEYEPGASVTLAVDGYMFDLEGSFEDNTAVLAGFIHSFGCPPCPQPVSALAFSLPNNVNWDIHANYVAGVLRGGDDVPPYNELNLVGIQELNAARNQFGETGNSVGDVTYDDVVDIDDLNLVRNNFGKTGRWNWSAPAAAVPEPAAALLMLAGLFALSMHRAPSRNRSWNLL